MKVWDKINPSIVDYVGIPVNTAVYPADLVVALGSVICFTSPLVSTEGKYIEESLYNKLMFMKDVP